MLRNILFHLILAFIFTTQIYAQIQSQDTLRVMAYNILGWSPGINKIETNLNQSNTMIAGFQEAWSVQRNTEMAQRMNWEFAFGGLGNDNYNGPYAGESFWINGYHMPQLLMTGYDLVDFKYYNIFDENNRGIPDAELWIWRGATLGEIEISSGRSVHVMVLHLNPWEDEWCIREMEEILGKMDSIPGPKIIMGDFNTRSHLDGYSGFQAVVHRMMQDSGYVDSYHFVNRQQQGRIDFIFSSLELRPITAMVVQPGTFGVEQGDSDHQPVFAEFIFDSVCVDPNLVTNINSGINYDFDIMDKSCNAKVPVYSDDLDMKINKEFYLQKEGLRIKIKLTIEQRTTVLISNIQGEILNSFETDNNGYGEFDLKKNSTGLLFLSAKINNKIITTIISPN